MSIIQNTFAATVALSISTGILLHDTHVDTIAATMNLPAHMNYDASAVNVKGMSTPDHTHVERASVSHLVGNLKSSVAHNLPRRDELKYRHQKRTSPGRHAFDDYHLPVVG